MLLEEFDMINKEELQKNHDNHDTLVNLLHQKEELLRIYQMYQERMNCKKSKWMPEDWANAAIFTVLNLLLVSFGLAIGAAIPQSFIPQLAFGFLSGGITIGSVTLATSCFKASREENKETYQQAVLDGLLTAMADLERQLDPITVDVPQPINQMNKEILEKKQELPLTTTELKKRLIKERTKFCCPWQEPIQYKR